MADATDKMRRALWLADAALCGADLDVHEVRQKIAEALAQQPAQTQVAGWLATHPREPHVRSIFFPGKNRPANHVVTWYDVVWTALYTVPPAQHAVASTAPVVPDWLPAVLSQHIEVAERSGWNGLHGTLVACREALAAAPEVPQ